MAEDGLGGLFSGLFADPAALKQLTALLSVLSGFSASAQTAGTEKPPPGQTLAVNATQSAPTKAVASPSPFDREEQARRKALLLALKPYLSPERAEAVDRILGLGSLIELLTLFQSKEG